MDKNKKKERLFVVFIVSVVLTIADVAFVGINFWTAKAALDKSLMRRARSHMQGIEIAVAITKRNMLQLAFHYADHDDLNQLFLQGKKGLELEGEGSATATAVREAMLQRVKPGWDEMTEQFDVRQLHYHLGLGSLSFLRVHKPSKYADRMDDIRYTVVDTNLEKKARMGFETGRVYSGLRGVVPISTIDPDNNLKTHVGALEVGTSYMGILKHIDEIQGIGSAVLLTKQHAERNMWPEEIERRFGGKLQNCECYIEASSRSAVETKEIILATKEIDFLGSVSALEIIELAGKYYIVYRTPLRDYRGELDASLPVAGSTVIWDEATSEITNFHQDIQLNIIYGVIGFIVIELVLFFAMGVKRKYHEIEQLVGLDGLTGIPNRRDFELRLVNEINRARRNNQTLSVVMCDVDYFKLFNDSYGHVEGDECLRQVAKSLANSLGRAGDYVARYGGEEFVFILPNTSIEQAVTVTEKARIAIECLAIEHKGSKVNAVVTMSFGVASTIFSDKENVDLINVADECLYEAKSVSRNVVVSKLV